MRLVPRPTLMQLLDRGAEGPVTLIAASAGSGKTLLVRAWLQSHAADRRAAWVSVERGERDPQHFWSAVVAAFKSATGGAAIELAPTPAFNGQVVVRRLLAALAVSDLQLTMVIDDLHELATEELRGQLADFLGQLPENVHVVLISRRDPQLGLHRRRLAGELTEIRNADLSFTPEETRELLSVFGIDLAPESLTLLHHRTEGWVAGLRLAAMTLAGHPEPDRFVSEFSGSERTVADYLLAEALEGQPAHVRKLLTRVSLLERVNGALGDLLTGESGSERELQALADAGGFVVALDASRTWFRLHHLFSDLLSVELRNTEAAEIPRLHALSAGWFAEHGLIIEAITHTEAAGDSQGAAGLLIEHYFSLTLDGRRATARALLERLDPEAVATSPELAIVMAAEQLVEGSLDQAAAYLALAERQQDSVPEGRRQRFATSLLVTRLTLARRRGDFRTVLDGVSAAVTAAEPANGHDLSMHNDVRALALSNLGIVEVWSGRYEDAEQHLTQARDLAERIGRPYLQLECQTHLAQLVAWGSFTRAGEASREVIRVAEQHGWEADPVVVPALVTLGTTLLQMGRFDEADHWLTLAEQTLRPELDPAVGFELQMARGGLLTARGSYGEALASFRAAQRLGLLLVSGSPLERQLHSSMLMAMLGAGDTAAARRALAAMSETEQDAVEVREVIAHLHLVDGDPVAALAALAPALGDAPDVHHTVAVVRSLLLAALAHEALGDTAAAEDALERALEVAEPDTLVLPFSHVECRELLERHPRHRTAHGALVSLILDVLSGQSPGPVPAQPSPLLEELSEAEVRVLRYLPTNLSAAGIADQIYVSVHTVKTHMRHIYSKLDAHSRAEAVTRARELGLLGHSRPR